MIKADILENGVILIYEKAVSDSVKFETIKFSFPPKWQGLEKTVVFKNGDVTVNIILEKDSEYCVSEEECYIPSEILVSPEFTVSVFGENEEKRATTARATVSVVQSGYEIGDYPNDPTQSEYSQILTIANQAKEIAESVKTDAQNGAFIGERGPKGDKGDKGDTGEQGTKGEVGPQGPRGETGDKGDTGEQGPKGDIGPQGPKGDKGDKGEKGEQGIQGIKGDKGDIGEQGERGFSGLIPRVSSPYYSEVTVPANTMVNFNELMGELNVSLGSGVVGYDNEWDFTVTQGEVGYNVVLPTVNWGFGIAPVFSANTTTLCRLYYIGNTLCGEWVTV